MVESCPIQSRQWRLVKKSDFSKGESGLERFAVDVQKNTQQRVLITLFGYIPPIVFALIYVYLNSPGLWSGLLILGLTIVIADTAQTVLTIMISPRHRMLSRLVSEGIRRRKRGTALILVGLMIGSAIVSSSLIVGDSLDATIEGRLIDSLGEADLVIRGTDPLTRQPVWMNESRMRGFLDGQFERSDVDAVSMEIHRRVAGITVGGERADPLIIWLAADASMRQNGTWPPLSPSHGWADIPTPTNNPTISETFSDNNILLNQSISNNSEAETSTSNDQSSTGSESLIVDDENSSVVISGAAVNEALAESLDLSVGDELKVSWSDISILSGVRRYNHTFQVTSIISSKGLGWPIGDQPLLLTSLEVAQELQDKRGKVTRLVISATGDVRGGLEFEPNLVVDIASELDEVLIAEDIQLATSSAAAAELLVISSGSAGGLLAVDDQEALDEALAAAGSSVRTSGVVQVPISGLNINGIDTIGLPHKQITAISLVGERIWFGTGDGVGILDLKNGTWRVWDAGKETAILDITPISTDLVAVGHADGLSILNSAGKEVTSSLLGARVVSVEVAAGYLHALRIEGDSAKLSSILIDSIENGNLAGIERDSGDINSVLRATLAASGNNLYLHQDRILGSVSCVLTADPLGPPIVVDGSEILANDSSCRNDTDGRTGVVTHGGEVWSVMVDDLVGLTGDATGLSLQNELPNSTLIDSSTSVLLIDSGSSKAVFWNGTGFEFSPIIISPDTIGPAALFSLNLNNNVTGGDGSDDVESYLVTSRTFGATISNSSENTPLLPAAHDLGLSQTTPPMAFALDGPLANLSEGIANGSFAPSTALAARLDVAAGSNISLLGFVAAATGTVGGEEMVLLEARPTPADLFGEEPALRSLDEAFLGYMSMSDAYDSINTEDVRMLLLLRLPNTPDEANETMRIVEQWADNVADLNSSSLHIDRIKRDTIEQTEGAGASFSALFLIFGSFVMLAGVLLLINIFVMLADDRRNELGILRAIGLQRAELRWLLGLEGALLALFASAAGSLLGLALARVMMWGMDQALQTNFGGSFAFGWSWSSLIAGFIAGVLTTRITLFVTALVVGRRNVIATIRRLPSETEGLPWWTLIFTLAALCASLALAILTFILGDSESGSGHVMWTSAGFLALFGIAPVVHMVLQRLLPGEFHIAGFRLHGPSVLPRITIGFLGFSMLLWGSWTDPIRARYEPSDWSFIVLGTFLVAAGVLVLTTIGPFFAKIIAIVSSRISPRSQAVLPTALAHPLSNPFRTSLTMGMYSLVVFAIVVLAGYSALFGNYLADLGDQASGEYEIIIIAGADGLDLDADASNWDLGSVNISDFDSVAQLSGSIVFAKPGWNSAAVGPDSADSASVGQAAASGDSAAQQESSESSQNTENNSAETTAETTQDADEPPQFAYRHLIGFDQNFTEHGALPLKSFSQEIGMTAAEVWAAVESDTTLAIIDSTLNANSYIAADGTIVDGGGIGLGQPIEIRDPADPLIVRTVWVAGILDEESGFLLSGVMVSERLVVDVFGGDVEMVWMSLPEGVTLSEQTEIAENIQTSLIEQGAYVLVIEKLFADLRGFFLSMFGLFRAFLGLGLSVGIAGLGVITVRNVSERWHQIGVLRAIGFQREMVIAGFLVEIAWVSVLGIINGVLVGIGFHHALWERYLREEGAEFILPWSAIATVAFGALILTLLATAAPVRRASLVEPAEALRTEH